MKKFLRALPTIVFSLILASCNYGLPMFLFTETGVEDRATKALPLFGPNLPQVGYRGKYSFIVLTDSHFGDSKHERRDQNFLLVFTTLLQTADPALRPSFIVNLGDSMDGGHESEADSFNATAAVWIETAKKELGVSDYKVYSILGNHDLYNSGWEVWRRKIYPYTSYYTFTLNAGGPYNFDFWFLDTGNGTLGANQIEDLENNLKKSARPKIVFMHYPVYAGGIFYFALDDVQERSILISDFAANNVKYVFEGHKHSIHSYDYKSFKEEVVGAYLENKVFGLVTVDESTGSVSFARMGY
ncbi:MAG: metallophosphoesterase [Treponema sp.]|nr:metallophosphoesterase [Treponema sp.]